MGGILKKIGIAFAVLLFLSPVAVVFLKDTDLVKELSNLIEEAVPSLTGGEQVSEDILVLSQKEIEVPDVLRQGAFLPGRQYLLNLPGGFSGEVIKSGLGDIGPMTKAEDGTVYLAVHNSGEIYRVVESETGLEVNKIELTSPTLESIYDLAAAPEGLYVFGNTDVYLFEYGENGIQDNGRTIASDLLRPSGGAASILAANGKVYVSINATCVLCEPTDERRATIMEIDPVTGESRIYARGLHEVQTMYWDSLSNAILAVDNKIAAGADSPAYVEFNYVEDGKHYGWPYCYNDRIPFAQYEESQAGFCETTEAPQNFGETCETCAGTTDLLKPEFSWPRYMDNKLILVANGVKDGGLAQGFKIMLFNPAAENTVALENFIYGWLLGAENWGAPHDVVELGDGKLLVSDSYNGSLYVFRFSKD